MMSSARCSSQLHRLPDLDALAKETSLPQLDVSAVVPPGEYPVLPPGDYAPTKEEFEARFVALGDMLQRKGVYQGWNAHRQALIDDGLIPEARQLLNGSYTEGKPSPDDIDLAVEVPLTVERLKKMNNSSPILRLLDGPAMKEGYKCDAYPIFCLPTSDPSYETVSVKAIRYWTKWFGVTRSGRPKGRVWATVGGLR